MGTIARDEGWLEKLPKRELCDAAREGRPKRADMEKLEESKKRDGRPVS